MSPSVLASGLLTVHSDYSLANKEIKCVPTLYLITYDDRYYVWEDAMEDFLRGRGLASHMQLFFAKKTFPDNLSISGENYIKDPS